jgi:hypothetical protein
VYNIKVLNSKTGVYEEIDLGKTYSFASIGYYIFEFGGGLSMFQDAKILQNDGMLDAELLERYIVENLGGVVGEEYAEMKPNITFTKGENSPEPEIPETGDKDEDSSFVILIVASIAFAVLLKANKKRC